MDDEKIAHKRAANLFETFARKNPAIAKASRFASPPGLDFADIGGLEGAKDEIATYACGATDPDIYQRWGTVAPSGLLLMGPGGSGKTMLAEALATRTRTPFLSLDVPRFVLQVVHGGSKPAELLQSFSTLLHELGPITMFYDELDFAHELTIGAPRPDLPAHQITDFLIEMIDATIGGPPKLILGSTSRPDTLSPIFFEAGRFERIVSVHPQVPGDVVAALEIHATAAEKQAERRLFDAVDWSRVIDQNREASIGNWVRLVHAVLRRKARCDAAGEQPSSVTTADLLSEVDRFRSTSTRLPARTGRYL